MDINTANQHYANKLLSLKESLMLVICRPAYLQLSTYWKLFFVGLKYKCHLPSLHREVHKWLVITVNDELLKEKSGLQISIDSSASDQYLHYRNLEFGAQSTPKFTYPGFDMSELDNSIQEKHRYCKTSMNQAMNWIPFWKTSYTDFCRTQEQWQERHGLVFLSYTKHSAVPKQ